MKGRNLKARIPKELFRSKWFRIALAVFLFLSIGTSITLLYYYNHYSRIIDRRLNGEVFENTARIYAAPYHVYPGQRITRDAVVTRLQRAGFKPMGTPNADEGVYEVKGNRVTIKPAQGSALRVDFEGGTVSRVADEKRGEVFDAALPAELVTNLFNQSRQKRRIVEFNEIPPNLVNALIAAEDQRFYSHWGLDPIRLVGAFVQRATGKSDRIKGTSTITQQVARNLFLSTDRSIFGRKIPEMFIALLLEQRLSKEQILTMFVNDEYLGQRGSFSIHGFGEASAAYFGKDMTGLTLPEIATLAAIIPSPNGIFSPIKHPDAVKARRNSILETMRKMGRITPEETDKAKLVELKVAPLKMDATDAPYLVDYIREELERDFSEDALISDSLRVYTTLNPDLQRSAVQAVESGLKGVYDIVAARNKGKKTAAQLALPQAAIIVLNPHTGEILAMVGGSDYATTQLNRITQAFRQPGSIFKAFVYAAAFEASEPKRSDPEPDPAANDGAADGDTPVLEPVHADADTELPSTNPDLITPLTTIEDVFTTFLYDNGKTYEPNNYHEKYEDLVSVRYALEHSLNVPTIKIAERIGYDRVVSLAKRSGLNAKIKAYPSVALGAFEVTPLEMAGAYTVFANEGKRAQPHALLRVLGADGKTAKSYSYTPQEVLSPQVAYMMTNIMEGVIRQGTGGGVRARGFTLPAAGKTGTSRDGWFAGYTKDFLAIAWVGYDDNRDLNIEGAKSALPIWTEFMKSATALYPPRDPDATFFSAPDGVKFVKVDPTSRALANSSCPVTYEEVFLEDVVPDMHCPLHGSSVSELIERGAGTVAGGIGGAFKKLGKALGGIISR